MDWIGLDWIGLNDTIWFGSLRFGSIYYSSSIIVVDINERIIRVIKIHVIVIPIRSVKSALPYKYCITFRVVIVRFFIPSVVELNRNSFSLRSLVWLILTTDEDKEKIHSLEPEESERRQSL